MVNQDLINCGLKNRINGGIVLTGGTALLANLADLDEQIFDLPVRIGYPVQIGGKAEEVHTPRCTTGVGLVMYGRQHQVDNRYSDSSMVGRMKDWLRKIM